LDGERKIRTAKRGDSWGFFETKRGAEVERNIARGPREGEPPVRPGAFGWGGRERKWWKG